ncbi:MAG: hypothetical protein AAGA92_12395 [Planctomycetota bacterium]
MRSALTVLLAVCAWSTGLTPSQGTTTSFHVGNSLTVDSRPQALSTWVPGHSTEWHVRFSWTTSQIVADPNDLSIASAVSWTTGLAQPIDHLVIQPYWRLNNPTATLATETAAVVDLIEYAQIANPNVEVYLLWSWPWLNIAEDDPGGWNGYWDSPYGSDPNAAMIMTRDFYEQLHAGVAAQTTADVWPVPVAEVMAYMRQSASLDPYYGNQPGDPIHLNSVGEYIPSATLAASMFGAYDVPQASGFFTGLQESDRAIIADAIQTVVPLEYWRFGDQDVDNDGDTDITDLLALQRGEFPAVLPAAVAIPEPGALTLALGLMLFRLGPRRRMHQAA